MSEDGAFVRMWPGRIGWYANVEKHIIGGISTELDRPWWRPTEKWASAAAKRWIRKARAQAAREAASKREPA